VELPDSPEDRRRQEDALRRIGRTLAIAFVPCVVIGLITHALGVPWFIIAGVLVLLLGYIVFEA
jgi:hypothetical protein